MSLARMDWDEPGTWPAAASGAGERQFDVLLGADLLYTRSYARKVGLHPIVQAPQHSPATLYQMSYPIQSLFF